MLRLLRRRGIPAFVVDDTSDIIVRSRWYRPAERRLAETSDGAELGAYLDGLSLPTAVLLPCSDRWTQAVAGLEPSLRERFVASVAPRAVVDQFIDKQAFAALVEELEIPRPRTFPVASAEDLAALADADVREGFLKPRESHRFYSHFGTKGQFVGSREEAAQFIRRGEEHGVEFMLQEWIPGPIPNTILIDG
ncbi:MAG TPA: hypothetical protein VET90_06195, partial [Candidatus Binatus sp.]|nr:hypothetical protein [Candidatus Binatus sp.]